MANQTLETGLAVLRFARDKTLKLLQDFPTDRWTHQPFPDANHALWNAGHLAQTDDSVLVSFKKRASALPDDWGHLFGMGSKPTGNVRDYPGFSEVQAALGTLHEELLAWFGTMDETRLAEALPADWQSFAANYGVLMSALAWHEGLHTGQIIALRKSLGLAPKFA
jgi:hypothetical protein